jgi:hypothetical protein
MDPRTMCIFDIEWTDSDYSNTSSLLLDSEGECGTSCFTGFKDQARARNLVRVRVSYIPEGLIRVAFLTVYG